MKFIHFAALSILLASVVSADIGQKGRERHHEMNDAVVESRASKAKAVAEAEARGETLPQKCADLVVKKGKRTIVIKCGDARRENPDCEVCGVRK